MMYADTDTQARLERLLILRGDRPPNSPGWGLVECVKTGELKSRNGKEVCRVIAGRTRVVAGYWAAVQWPEFFRPCDKRDVRTISSHRSNLQRAQQELERTPARPATRTRVLPPRKSARRPWQL
jgi:hypothetical protein